MKIKTRYRVHSTLFTVILLFAAILRLTALGSNPAHLTSDEAALGVNAYSILKTGRDEHGAFLPVIFESFGDWKPGLYVYSAIPIVAVFGLTEFAVRLPSAMAGVVAVYLIYKLVRSLRPGGDNWALLAALLLAVNPWHIHFSRGAWEANLALTITLGAILAFYKSFGDKKYIFLSAVLFVLTLWTYQGAKLATSIVVLALTVANYKSLINFDKKYLSYATVTGVLIAAPIVLSLFQGKTGRLAVFSVFSYTRSEADIWKILSQDDLNGPNFVFSLFHSEQWNLARGVMGRYFNYFAGKFLFFEGDWANARHSSPNIGYLLYADFAALIFGLYLLFRKKITPQNGFVLLWLVLAPLPGALSRDSVNGVRTLNMVIPLVLVASLGLSVLITKVKSKLFYLALAGAYVFSFVLYLDAFWIHAPVDNSRFWQYGYKQMVAMIGDDHERYNEIVIPQSFDQPYIFFLFYSPELLSEKREFEPSEFGDVGLVTKLGNVSFRMVNWSSDREKTGSVVVTAPTGIDLGDLKGNPDKFDYELISYLNGAPAFYLVKPK